jgi:hypothetical protein
MIDRTSPKSISGTGDVVKSVFGPVREENKSSNSFPWLIFSTNNEIGIIRRPVYGEMSMSDRDIANNSVIFEIWNQG